jgi:hypothetical protein
VCGSGIDKGPVLVLCFGTHSFDDIQVPVKFFVNAKIQLRYKARFFLSQSNAIGVLMLLSQKPDPSQSF